MELEFKLRQLQTRNERDSSVFESGAKKQRVENKENKDPNRNAQTGEEDFYSFENDSDQFFEKGQMLDMPDYMNVYPPQHPQSFSRCSQSKQLSQHVRNNVFPERNGIPVFYSANKVLEGPAQHYNISNFCIKGDVLQQQMKLGLQSP